MVNPLTIAAATAAGPLVPGQEAAWFARVKQIAVGLTLADVDITERCDLLAKIQLGPDTNKGGTKGWGIVTGILRKVEIETRSKRGLLTYEAYDRKTQEFKTETIRTNFVADPDAAALVETAKSLIGHEVGLYKYQEPMADGSGQTVKILAHLVDRGVPGQQGQPSQPQQASAPARPAEARPQPQDRPQAQRPTPAPAPVREEPPVEEPPADEPPANDGGWPAVAGPEAPSVIPVNEAKRRVMDGVGGDVTKAQQAWAAIGSPTGEVTLADVQKAIDSQINKAA